MNIQLLTNGTGNIIGNAIGSTIIGIISIIILITGIILLKRKPRHKAIPITMIVLGGVVLAGCLFSGIGILLFFSTFGGKAASSISIIGGADGPTSIFLAGKLNTPNYGMLIVGIVFLVLAFYMIWKKKIPFLKSYDGVKDIPKYSRTMGLGILVFAIFLLIGAVINIPIVIMVLVSIAIAFLILIVTRKY